MPTRYQGTETERLALDAYVKLVRAANSAGTRAHATVARERGLTETQFAVLEALLHLGPLTHGQISAKILKSGSNVTTVIDNLERNGWVVRERDPNDRRVQTVTLTTEGRALIEEIFPEHVRGVVQVLGALAPEEQRELGRLCRKLGLGACG
jgi:MarR family 2-MHQ and catechol resistance regulon transcriptional repressor